MKVATGKKTEVKSPRTVCPKCKAAYMQQIYVMICESKKRNWKTVGKYCNACGHTEIEKRESGKDS